MIDYSCFNRYPGMSAEDFDDFEEEEGEIDFADDDSEGDGDPIFAPGPDEASDSIDSYAEGLDDR